MSPLLQRAARSLIIVLTFYYLLLAVLSAIGVRVNTTKSIPVGLYWKSHHPIEKGAYVEYCPPQVDVFVEAKKRGYLGSGICAGDYSFLMKRIAAVSSDRVSITADGVTVNDHLLPYSVPLVSDKDGQLMPRPQSDHFILGNSEVLLMSDVSRTSFDGRYFGAVNRAQIMTVIVPVFTW